jgi:hypothetical protein
MHAMMMWQQQIAILAVHARHDDVAAADCDIGGSIWYQRHEQKLLLPSVLYIKLLRPRGCCLWCFPQCPNAAAAAASIYSY